MAFNPFDVFRRNQKILFAILTVVVMFMFVLSFGQGDFFSQVPRWLASNRKSGTVLAELNGTKVYSSELEQARGERVLANQYMYAAARRGADVLRKYVADGQGRASAEAKSVIDGAVRSQSLLGFLAGQGMQDPQTANFVIQQVTQALAGLDGILTAKAPKQDDQELAAAAKSMLELSLRTMFAKTPHYFVNQPNDGNRDVMDYLLWRKKADQLGIRLDDKAVIRLANDEFYGKLGNDDWKAAEDAVRGKQGFNADALRRALADEFRVRAAQTAVLGSQTVRPNGQEYDAPYDYFKFYRDQTNSARYGLVVVPADNYLDKVAGQPTEAELQDLFRKGRNVEPDPRLPAVGLKEPRRLKLGYVEVTGTEPYYKAKAEATVKAAEAVADPATPQAAAASALAGPGVIAGFEPPVKRQYAQYKREHGQLVTADWATPTPFRGGRPLDAHVLEPVNIAAMTAAFAAGGALTGPTVLVADSFASDRIAKIESVLPVMTAPVGPGVSALAGVLGLAGGYDAFIQPLPPAAVRGLLTERARDEQARQVATADMQTFGTDLAKLAGKPAEAQAKIEAFAKERGLKVGGSNDLRDRFTLASDPGLKPLEERFQAEAAVRMLRGGGFVDPLNFSDQFFFELDPTGGGRPRPSVGLFKPQAYPESAQNGPVPGQPAYLVWRSAEQPAEAARTLDDPTKNLNGLTVRDKAVAGWRRLKARESARKEAEELAKRAGGFGTSSVEIEMKLRDEAAKLAGQFPSPEAKARVSYFEIDRVAPLASESSLMANRPSVVPFSVPRSAFLPYPTQEFQDTLLSNRAKPLSTAVALADNPGDRQYVTVLLQKSENSADAFGLTVYGPTAQFNELARAVQGRHQEDLRRENRDRAVSLLKAEFRYEKESDELNKRAEVFGD